MNESAHADRAWHRRPAWQVALPFLLLRVGHAAFAPWSTHGLALVHGLGVLLLVAWIAAKSPALRKFIRMSLEPAATHDVRAHSTGWFVAGVALVVLGIANLERRDYPFFLQDDNYDQFLPVMTWAWRSVRAGSLPLWNPHQFMGAPAFDVGTYALSYPPTYLSCALAEWVGHPEAALEVFAVVHLLAAYAATFWAARMIGIGAPIASTAALCFTLSGYHLVAGRDWYYMLPVAVWLPLLLGLLARWAMQPVGVAWALAVAACCGLQFHAGNAQMWTYSTMLFMACALLLVAQRHVPARRLVWLAAGLIGAASIAAPLLVPQLALVHDLKRELIRGGDIARGLHAMLVPFGLVSAPHPSRSGSWIPTSSDYALLYSAGGLLPSIALAGLSMVAVVRPTSIARAPLVWSYGMLLTFLLALGRHGLIWPLLTQLPVFASYQLPYKLLGPFNLFACLAGALILERWIAACTSSKTWTRGVWLFGACVSLHGTWGVVPSNHAWPERAYSPPGPALRAHLSQHQRLLALSPRRTAEPDPPRHG